MKLAIVGSRNFNNYDLLCDLLESKKVKITTIISGGAVGADSLGKKFAMENNINYIEYLPNWSTHGKSAGYIRNKLIIENSDAVLAFWDGISKGTKHSIDIAISLKKPIKIINF